MEFIPLIIKQLPTILSVIAIFFVFIFYKLAIYSLKETQFADIYTFLNNK